MFKKKITEGRKTKDLKVDESKLSQEEKENSGYKFRKGLLIFCIIIFLLIIGLAIGIIIINQNTK